MIYLLNSFPNALQPVEGQQISIKGISTSEAQMLLTTVDPYQDHDDHIAPTQLSKGIVSAIGHQSVADLVSDLLWNDAHHCYKPVKPQVLVNRISVRPVAGDKCVCLLSTPSRRLAGEDDRWTVEEIKTMPTKWVVVYF